MAVVAGIDEAGYGPLLGPLVVSATAFRVPDEAAGADLWELFGSIVTRRGAGFPSGRIRVADSKALHKGRNGIRALEENLLPFLMLLGLGLTSLWELVARCRCPTMAAENREGYPWYRDRDLPLPRVVSAERISDRARRLREGLAAAGGALCDARAETLDVAEFNLEVRRADNKAVPLARCVAALMQHVCNAAGEENVTLFVDRQGGRKSYGAFLRTTFPGCRLEAISETDLRSEYAISCGARRPFDHAQGGPEHGRMGRIRVLFEVRADSLYLPVALASMLSKYTRELHMEMLNDFWRGRVPGLRPTAGYYEDGLRFLADIEPARAAEGIPVERLVRCR